MYIYQLTLPVVKIRADEPVLQVIGSNPIQAWIFFQALFSQLATLST